MDARFLAVIINRSTTFIWNNRNKMNIEFIFKRFFQKGQHKKLEGIMK